MNTDTVRCGLSLNFHNKTNIAPVTRYCQQHTRAAQLEENKAAKEAEREPRKVAAVVDRCWAFSRFPATSLTVAAFVDHVLSGKAWTPSTFGGAGRRVNDNWQQAELIAVDYDHNVSVSDCLAIDLVRQYALLVHPSASSGKDGVYKTRVIFRLETPITGDFENYRLAARAVCEALQLEVDPASFKPAQLYYGSDNQIEAPCRLWHTLPAVVLDNLIAPLRTRAELEHLAAEQRRAERRYVPIDSNGDAARAKIARILDDAYRKVAYLQAGQDRTGTANGQAWRLARYLAYWSLTENDIERTLLDALRANGATQKYGEAECSRHITNGIASGKRAAAEPLELPQQAASRPPVQHPQVDSPLPAPPVIASGQYAVRRKVSAHLNELRRAK